MLLELDELLLLEFEELLSLEFAELLLLELDELLSLELDELLLLELDELLSLEFEELLLFELDDWSFQDATSVLAEAVAGAMVSPAPASIAEAVSIVTFFMIFTPTESPRERSAPVACNAC